VKSDFLIHIVDFFLYWVAALGEESEERRRLDDVGVVFPSLRLSLDGEAGG